jgi:hypothetical protein
MIMKESLSENISYRRGENLVIMEIGTIHVRILLLSLVTIYLYYYQKKKNKMHGIILLKLKYLTLKV